MKSLIPLILLAVLGLATFTECTARADQSTASRPAIPEPAADTTAVKASAEADTADRFTRLTDEDYRAVAEELGIEVATMKAVTDIEAGRTHEGFSAPGVPLVNFDISMFNRIAPRHGVNLSKARASHPAAFKRNGSGQAAVNRRLAEARKIHDKAALESTFWGMFQIGGFNWKKCGCESVEDFVEKMSNSERDQLELFAKFVVNTGLVKYLRTKNWSAFARGYNGPSYASRGYHTKLAKAYARYK